MCAIYDKSDPNANVETCLLILVGYPVFLPVVAHTIANKLVLPGVILVLNPPLAGDLTGVLPDDGGVGNLSSWLGGGVDEEPGRDPDLEQPTPSRTKG